MTIFEEDLLVLSNLRTDGRMKLTKLSRTTRIPVSTLHDKLKQYKKSFIKKSTILLNFKLIGYNILTYIILKVRKEERDEIRDFLIQSKSINSAFKINNGYDLLLEGVFRDFEEADNFLEELEKNFTIKQKDIFYVIDEIKRENFLSNEGL